MLMTTTTKRWSDRFKYGAVELAPVMCIDEEKRIDMQSGGGMPLDGLYSWPGFVSACGRGIFEKTGGGAGGGAVKGVRFTCTLIDAC